MELYWQFLPPFLFTSVRIGYLIGLTTKNKRINGNIPSINELYANMIGYTALGFLTGYLYPIVYPVFLGYTIYKKLK